MTQIDTAISCCHSLQPPIPPPFRLAHPLTIDCQTNTRPACTPQKPAATMITKTTERETVAAVQETL